MSFLDNEPALFLLSEMKPLMKWLSYIHLLKQSICASQTYTHFQVRNLRLRKMKVFSPTFRKLVSKSANIKSQSHLSKPSPFYQIIALCSNNTTTGKKIAISLQIK